MLWGRGCFPFGVVTKGRRQAEKAGWLAGHIFEAVEVLELTLRSHRVRSTPCDTPFQVSILP